MLVQQMRSLHAGNPDVETGVRRARTALPREKGLWNFLTWSFFLSQILVAEQFIGTAARAADGVEPAASPEGSPTQATPESAQPLADVHAQGAGEQTLGAGAATQEATPSLHLPADPAGQGMHAEAEFARVAADGADAAPSVGVGGLSLVSAEGLLGEGLNIPLSTDLGLNLDLGGVLGGVGDGLSGLLGGVLEPVVEGVVAPVVDLVDDVLGTLVPVVGQVLAPVTGLVGGVVQTLDPVTGLLGKLVHSLVPNVAPDVVASGGSLSFAPVIPDLGLDDLFAGGSHTDLGLALQSTAASGMSSGGAAASLLDHLVGGAHADSAPDQGHSDGSGQNITLPSILDEIALRGLGDGIG